MHDCIGPKIPAAVDTRRGSSCPADKKGMNKGFDTFVVALVLLSCAGTSSTPAVAASGADTASCAAPHVRCRVSVPRVGAPALSDAAAARLVRRASWEPRLDNAVDNHRVPSSTDLA